jgi:release factor glutamine methyltransferase
MTDPRDLLPPLDLIARAAEFLAAQGIDESRLTAELLLAHVLGVRRLDLYLQFERPLTPEEREAFREAVRRRVNGEPLQYIVGEAEFMDFRLRVTRDVLIPRPETEMLVELAFDAASSSGKSALRVLDIGTGSGNIALAFARRFPSARVVAVDASPAAVDVARDNGARLGVSNVEFACRDLFAPWPEKEEYDFVVTNPPYVSRAEFALVQKEIKDFEPRMAVTDEGDGFTAVRRVLDLARALLVPGGELWMEIGYGQSEAVGALVAAAGLDYRATHPDYGSIPRVVHAVQPQGTAQP